MVRTACERHASRRMRAATRGFTLVEMVTVVLILAILVTIGLPSFNDATLGSRLGSTANDLTVAAYLARSEAMKRNRSVTLCTSTNGTSCATSGGWEQGWIVLEPTTSTVIQYQQARGSGFKVIAKNAGNAAFYQLVFLPTGVGVTPDAGSAPVQFKVCRATPDVGKHERVVTVSNLGKPSVARTQTGTCS